MNKVLFDERLGAKLRVTGNRCVLFFNLCIHKYMHVYIGSLVLATKLKRKLVTVKSLKAHVSSVSPSSERFEELWVVCGLCVCLYADNGATLLVEMW